MFELIDSKGDALFKANETNVEGYLSSGSNKHSKILYYFNLCSIFQDLYKLKEWAKKSIVTSK